MRLLLLAHIQNGIPQTYIWEIVFGECIDIFLTFYVVAKVADLIQAAKPSRLKNARIDIF